MHSVYLFWRKLKGTNRNFEVNSSMPLPAQTPTPPFIGTYSYHFSLSLALTYLSRSHLPSPWRVMLISWLTENRTIGPFEDVNLTPCLGMKSGQPNKKSHWLPKEKKKKRKIRNPVLNATEISPPHYSQRELGLSQCTPTLSQNAMRFLIHWELISETHSDTQW